MKKQAPMPSLSHLRMKDYANVYEPSDDTFLLLDALYLEFSGSVDVDGDAEICSRNASIENTLELGCGTGVATVFLAQILRGLVDPYNNGGEGSSDGHEQTERHQKKQEELLHMNHTCKCQHYVTDVNEYALQVTSQTAQENGLLQQDNGDIIATKCDLASALLTDLKGSIDVLIFNPPYVPTPDDEVGSDGIEASWAGGADGRVVIDRALPQIAELLSETGVAYMITVDDNYPEDIADLMLSSYKIRMEPFMRRKACNEYLTVQKMVRIKQ